MTLMKEKVRTVTFLSRQQLDFLDKVGKDALFYHGIKISRSEILSELVDLLMHLGINLKKIDVSKETMEQALLKMLNNHQSHTENEHKNVQIGQMMGEQNEIKTYAST